MVFRILLSIMWLWSVALLVPFAAAQLTDPSTVSVGSKVCFEGYIMDFFCIARGTLFDNPSVKTLEGPEQHSVHCLIDVSQCNSSPYEILMPEGSNYGRAFRFDDDGRAELIKIAATFGHPNPPGGIRCTECLGDGTLSRGFRAQVTGTVTKLASGETPATIVLETAEWSNEKTEVCGAARGAPWVAAEVAPTPAAVAPPPPTRATAADSPTMDEPTAGEASPTMDDMMDNEPTAGEASPTMDDMTVDSPTEASAPTDTMEASEVPAIVNPRAAQVGDEICFEGFVMDFFCIGRGTLLDAPSIRTLENPGAHSVHCLIDIPNCRNSDYELLLEPASEDAMFTRAFRIEDDSKQMLIGLASEVGNPNPSDVAGCSMCTGGGTLSSGFRAQVNAMVVAPANGDVPPVIQITSAPIHSNDLDTVCGLTRTAIAEARAALPPPASGSSLAADDTDLPMMILGIISSVAFGGLIAFSIYTNTFQTEKN